MSRAGALGPYAAVLAVRYRMLLQYRAAALAGFGTQLFFGAIRLMVLAAFYAAASVQPLSLADVVSYVWLGQAFYALLPWNVDPELAQEIRSGGVAYELLRPLDLYDYWFARTLAFRTARTSLRALPLLVVAIFVLPLVGLERWALPLPADLPSAGAFLLSFCGMVLMSSAITMLMHVALLYTRSSQAPNQLAAPVVVLLSGIIVPLPLFPDGMQLLLALQPLRGLGDVPFRIYSGQIAAGAAWDDILQQFAWSALFITTGRELLARALRTSVVQGG